MKTIQDIFDEINEQQLSIAKIMLEDHASVPTSKTPDTNCPNCGAPRQGRSCEYCGTVFISDYVANLGDTLIRNRILTANEMRDILGFKPSEEEEAKLELQQKLQGELATIKIAEQQRQMIQSIMPYGFSPLANTPQCCSIQDSIQQQLNASQCCCSIQNSIQRQYDLQQCSATF